MQKNSLIIILITYYLSLNELKENGYIKEDDIADPRDNSTMTGCITIRLNNEKYEYTYVEESCHENQMITTSILEKVNLSNHISKLDPDENIRYVGKNPDNYVNFNNELWRIVGIFNGKVKIVRDDYYNEKIPWNDTNINDWKESSLNKELNENFYSQIDSTSKSYIAESSWNLEGYNETEFTREELYESLKEDSWKGMIGLLYPSDYGYATSNENCNTDMNHWNEECYQNSWLYSESSEWTMTSNNSNTHNIFVYNKGLITTASSENKNISVRPTLYLKENVKITKGNGTKSNPYDLMM